MQEQYIKNTMKWKSGYFQVQLQDISSSKHEIDFQICFNWVKQYLEAKNATLAGTEGQDHGPAITVAVEDIPGLDPNFEAALLYICHLHA